MDASLLYYQNGFEQEPALRNTIIGAMNRLLIVNGVDRGKFLLALSGNETLYGKKNYPKHEQAYDFNGFYFKKSDLLRQEFEKYGSLSACSYGPWQILYISARELGFRNHPLELTRSNISIDYVIRYLNNKIDDGAQSIEDLADAWNTGSFKDNNRPLNYIADLKKRYESLPAFE